MAEAMRGVRVKPTYESLIGLAFSYGLEHVKFTSRDASFLRNGFIYHNLITKAWGKCNYSQNKQASKHLKKAY